MTQIARLDENLVCGLVGLVSASGRQPTSGASHGLTHAHAPDSGVPHTVDRDVTFIGWAQIDCS